MRTNDKPWAACGLYMVILASALNSPGSALAQGASSTSLPPQGAAGACGLGLSEPVAGAWRAFGGEGGRLGCPTAIEAAGSPSPQGSADRVATFGQNGLIVLAVSGPRAGQAFAVSGGCFRLYVQYGGTSGWLGLPTGDQENTPDGSIQRFEGGAMRWDRAVDDCQAEPSTAAPARAVVVPAGALIPLDLFEDPATGDRLSLAAAGSIAQATSAGYRRLRGQARVLSVESPGTMRLKLYANAAKSLRETLASIQSEREAQAAGFTFEAGQGWVWTDPQPGSIALKLYRDPSTGRTQLTAGDEDEREALGKSFRFVRIEGYAPSVY